MGVSSWWTFARTTHDQGALMTSWTSRLQPSPDLGIASRSVVTHMLVPPKRVLVAMALSCLALGVVLHQGLAVGSGPVPSVMRSHADSREGLLSLPLAAQGPVSTALGRHQAAYRIEG